MKVLLLVVVQLTVSLSIHAQFSDFLSKDLYETHRDEFELNKLIQACSEGGDYEKYEQIYTSYFKPKKGIWGVIPELYHTSAFYGQKRLAEQLDSLQQIGWTNLEIEQSKLIIALMNKSYVEADKQLETLRKSHPDDYEILRAEILFVLHQNTFWYYDDEHKDRGLQTLKQISNFLQNQKCDPNQCVFLRLAQYDLTELFKQKEYSDSKQLLDSLWKAQPSSLNPFTVWIHLKKEKAEIEQTAFDLITNQHLEDSGEYWQTLAIMQNGRCDFQQPKALHQYISTLPDEMSQQIAKSIVFAQTYEHKSNFSLDLGALSFLIPKVQTPPMQAAVRATFRVNLTVDQWNRLLQKVTGSQKTISMEQLNPVLEKLPEEMKQAEKLQLIFGSLIRAFTEISLAGVSAKILTKDYAKQPKLTEEVLTNWTSLFNYLEKHPNYLLKGMSTGIRSDYPPTLNQNYPILFGTRDSLLAALKNLDNLAQRFPGCEAIWHNKMTVITLNCKSGKLALTNPDKELVRMYGQAAITAACLEKDYNFDNVHNAAPLVSEEEYNSYNDVFAMFSRSELTNFNKQIAKSFKKYPQNKNLEYLESVLEQLLEEE